jgi:hypothetical protein
LRSDRTKNLRDLLLSLIPLRVKQDGDYLITREDFLKMAATFLSEEEVRSAFNRYVLNGETITFTNDMLMPAFRVHQEGTFPVLDMADPTVIPSEFPGTIR